MQRLSVCKKCEELISDFEALHYEGHCFYCAEAVDDERANTQGVSNENK